MKSGRVFGDFSRAGLLLCLLLPVPGLADDIDSRMPFPGNEPVEKTLRDRERAERFFAEENFRRSLFIFEKDLAVLGDKYAQYMVGVHHEHGLSVPQDLPLAYAWHRLAAERGNPKLMGLRDALGLKLTNEQQRIAGELFTDIQERHGDRALLTRLIRNDMALLRASVGSRVGAQGSPVTIVTRDGQPRIGATYYRDMEQRIEARMTYLSGRVEYGELRSIRDELDEIEALRQAPGEKPETVRPDEVEPIAE